MLEAVPFSGTAASAFSAGGWGERPVAGKTGTAQENTNVWFSGYTAQYTTAVWVGSPGNPYSMGSVFGGTVAAPIWVAYMSRIMQGLPMLGFPDPPKPPEGPVPNVVGMGQKEAKRTLAEAGFRVEVTIGDSLAPRGQVFSQSPGGGSVIPLGTLVTVQISTGEPPMVKVPRLVGSSKRDATQLLTSLGLVVNVLEVEVGDPDLDGIVLSQAPDRKTIVPQGTTVTISVGVQATGGGNGGGNGGGGNGGGGGDGSGDGG